MLAIAQTAQKFGQRPSEILEINSKTLALDFDITCSYRLLLLDLERNRAEADAMNGEDVPEKIKARITKDTLRW